MSVSLSELHCITTQKAVLFTYCLVFLLPAIQGGEKMQYSRQNSGKSDREMGKSTVHHKNILLHIMLDTE
jgi:hypothetical protein